MSRGPSVAMVRSALSYGQSSSPPSEAESALGQLVGGQHRPAEQRTNISRTAVRKEPASKVYLVVDDGWQSIR